MEPDNPYDPPYSEPPPPDGMEPERAAGPALSVFDRICAGLAFLLGIVLVVLGLLGLFFGCRANFTLPPVLGGLPALVGWGILKSVRVAWRSGKRPESSS